MGSDLSFIYFCIHLYISLGMSTQGTLQIQTQSIYTSLLVQSCHLLQLCARMVLRTDAARFVGYRTNVVLLILRQPSDMCCKTSYTFRALWLVSCPVHHSILLFESTDYWQPILTYGWQHKHQTSKINGHHNNMFMCKCPLCFEYFPCQLCHDEIKFDNELDLNKNNKLSRY